MLFLVTANGGHLRLPYCKKSKRLHTRNILAQTWINFNQWFLRYRHFHVYAIFSNGPWQTFTGTFLFNFETTQCKNHFDTNLVKIHSAVTEILSFSCSVRFLVTPNGGHLGIPNCKKKNKKRLHTRNNLHNVGSISTNGS